MTFESTVPEKPYVSMENPEEQVLAEEDPKRFFERFPKGAIIDEIQRSPSLLSYLQGVVDDKNEKGLFILTGSHQAILHQAISQSLAGRTAILQLLPFSMNELQQIRPEFTTDEFLFHGMYPRIHADHIDSTKFYRDYVGTYLERDVRQIRNVKNLKVFQNFLKLCASRVGQLLNTTNIANNVGISHTTVINWLSILEASFIIYRLPPYFETFGKRIIKAPKLFFTDTGLARYLLDILTLEQISRDPLRGNLFENFVITECVKHQLNRGVESNFYFYRDSNDNEIDCLYRDGHRIIAMEIKASQTFNRSFLNSMKKFEILTEERFGKGFVIYAGQQEQRAGNYELLNFMHLGKVFDNPPVFAGDGKA